MLLAAYVQDCKPFHVIGSTTGLFGPEKLKRHFKPDDTFFWCPQALHARKAEIRVQLKSPEPLEGAPANMCELRNELVLRLQPNEAIYMKMALKEPGLQMRPIMSELDLTYRVRWGARGGGGGGG